MTPHELNLHILEYHERQKREDERFLMQAYLVSVWHPYRTKRLPDWSEITKSTKTKPKKRKSDKQMLEQVKMLNAMFGGKTVSGE